MKKIGLLIDTMNSGGAQRVVSHLSRILSEKYDVYVILFENTYNEYQCYGTQCCLHVPSSKGDICTKLRLLWKRCRNLKKIIQNQQLDCVISFLDSPNFVNLLTRGTNCRKFISIRNYSGIENTQSSLGKLTNIAMKVLYRYADYVIAVSKLIEIDFHEHYGISKKHICTIYNPYNFNEINELGSLLLSTREQLFYDKHFVFANVGRIMYQKGIWHLIKAFSIVHTRHPETRLIIVGEDLSQGKLLNLIELLGIGDCVMLPGRTRNPYQYMKNANCYVLSSLFEGFPNAMVEAMACGCPVIAADCKSGPREILYENVDLDVVVDEIIEADYGILVPELEAEENWNFSVITQGEEMLAKAMLSIYQNKDKARDYSIKAKERSAVFSFRRCYEQYSQIIEESI